MPVTGITSKLVSILGNKESLIPIMVKDGVDSASLTYHSYKAGGTAEGRDRAIDEFGTQAVWIGGIPFYKKLIDALVYKKAKLHPGVDARIIANKEYTLWAQKNAQGMMKNGGFLSKLKFLQPEETSVKSAFDAAVRDGGKKYKNLYAAKVIASTVLTLGTFFALTKYKQNQTKKTVLAEINKNSSDNLNKQISFSAQKETKQNNKIFNSISDFSLKTDAGKKAKTPSFKGLKQAANAVLYNPVHNMQIIDAGITAERLACSRNKTEAAEHAIKEGGFLFFLYGFGNMLEKAVNKFSSEKLNIPIDASIDVILDDKFKTALKEGSLIKDVSKLPENGSLTDKLNFVINNPDNILVRAAKKSNIVSETKDVSGRIFVDTSKYIDIAKLENLAENLNEAARKFKQSGLSIDDYISKMKKMKIFSSMSNIAASCLFLGYLIPKAVYKYREYKTGTREFHAAIDIKNEQNKNKLKTSKV